MNISRYHIPIIWLMWLLIHVVLYMHFGVRHLYDADRHQEHAIYFLEHFQLQDTRFIFYSVPLTLLAFFHWLSPDHVLPFIVFQCVLSGFAVVALYRSVTKVFNSPHAALCSSFFFLLWIDNIHWNITLMTESLLCSFIMFLIYFLVGFKGSFKNYLVVAALGLIVLLSRPNGVVVVVGVIGFLLQFNWHVIKRVPMLKYSVFLTLLIALVIGAYMMLLHWDFTSQYKRGNVVTYVDLIDGGHFNTSFLQLHDNNLKFADDHAHSVYKIFYFIVHNPIYFLKSSFIKVFLLVTGIRPYYSTLHNAFTICWMLVIYISFFLGWGKVQTKPLKVFVAVTIITNCGLTAISTVDWDNRFYIPMEPSIVLVAAGGLFFLFRRLFNSKSDPELQKHA